MLTEGQIAPQFTLSNQDGVHRMLSDFIGSWVILYFYPKDDTPGCTTEACTFRDNFPFYEEVGIAVVGISKDSPESHKKFKERYELPFELLSDPEGITIRAYGAEKETGGVARISYLMRPDGTIAKAYPTVSPATHAEEVLRDMTALR